MKIISASDFHIHDDSRKGRIGQFRSMVLKEQPDVLVLNGDVFDPWKALWEEIIQTESYNLLSDLSGRVKTIYINRNHDYNAPIWILPSATRCGQYSSGRWLFMHGWEFSMDWGWLGLSRPLFWLSMHWPGLMIPLHRMFLPEHPSAAGSHDVRQDWTVSTGIAHVRAQQYAQKHNVNLCIGHYHCPTNYDGLLVDDGDFEDSWSYVIVPNDSEDRAELRTL